MKKIVNLFGLICLLFLLITCQPNEEEFEGGTFYRILVKEESSTNSYIQVSDSLVNFNQIEGCYGCFRGEINRYFFYFILTNSLNSEEYPLNYFRIDLNTKTMPPEDFFQKRRWEIDSYINHHTPGSIGSNYLPPQEGYCATQCVFTWDSISYENNTFKGKGVLEIKDTLSFDIPTHFYYPPQKIEFEFK
jgi:hypothetical protein